MTLKKCSLPALDEVVNFLTLKELHQCEISLIWVYPGPFGLVWPTTKKPKFMLIRSHYLKNFHPRLFAPDFNFQHYSVLFNPSGIQILWQCFSLWAVLSDRMAFYGEFKYLSCVQYWKLLILQIQKIYVTNDLHQVFFQFLR